MSPDLTSFWTASAKRRLAWRYASQSVSSNWISPGWSAGAHVVSSTSTRAKEGERGVRTVEEGPEDRVGEAVVVALRDLVRDVDGDARKVLGQLLGDELAVDLGDVEACTVRGGRVSRRTGRASRGREEVEAHQASRSTADSRGTVSGALVGAHREGRDARQSPSSSCNRRAPRRDRRSRQRSGSRPRLWGRP